MTSNLVRPIMRQLSTALADPGRALRNTSLVIIGTLLAALAYVLFQIPFDLAAGGLSGIAIIINHFTGWSIGLTFFVLSLPLLYVGYRYLGGWPFLTYTLLSSFVFSAATDFLLWYLPPLLDQYPLTDDVLLSSIYAGIISGIGGGLIYRAGGTRGGTGVLARLLQQRTGIPLSQIYMYTEGLIVLTAGLVFSWEVALHAMLVIFLNGMAADFILEGPSMVRMAIIVTNLPDQVIAALRRDLQQGASFWGVQGGYTGRPRSIVLCTIHRSQMDRLKYVIGNTDKDAFVTIATAHQALGANFLNLPSEGKPPDGEA